MPGYCSSTKYANTHLYTWVERENSVLHKSTRQCPEPGLKPRLFDLEANSTSTISCPIRVTCYSVALFKLEKALPLEEHAASLMLLAGGQQVSTGEQNVLNSTSL